MAAPSGGPDETATYTVNSNITIPKPFANPSTRDNTSLDRKIHTARPALKTAPTPTGRPVNTCKPIPAPARLPMLKANPPTTTMPVNTRPDPVNTRSAISCTRNPLTLTIRHMFT